MEEGAGVLVCMCVSIGGEVDESKIFYLRVRCAQMPHI